MKRKSKKQADDLLKTVEEEPQPKKIDTQPLVIDSYVKFVKCIYNSPVNVRNAPSGNEYSFQPGQTLPILDERDFNFLLALKRNPGPGCCGGAKPEARTYFKEA